MNNLDLLKSHVDQYTKTDGTVVQAHDDKRTAAQPASSGYKVTHNVSGSGLKEGGVVPVKAKPEAVEKKLGMKPGSLAASGSDGHYSESHRVTHSGGTQHSIYSSGGEVRVRAYKHADSDATKALVDHLDSDSEEPAKTEDAYGHPNVVGKPDRMVQGNWSKETGYKETPHTGKPTDAHAIHFLGKRYLTSSKTGASMHDGTPTRAFNEDDGSDEGGHRVWLDDKARVHADGGDEVKGLRAKYEAHSKKAKPQVNPANNAPGERKKPASEIITPRMRREAEEQADAEKAKK